MDENEVVQFEFTGDSTSLQSAAADAIGSLDALEAAAQRANQSVNFSGVTNSIKQEFAGASVVVENFQAFLSQLHAPDVSAGMAPLSATVDQVNASVSALQSSFQMIPDAAAGINPVLQSLQDHADSAAKATSGMGSETEAAFRRMQDAADDVDGALLSETERVDKLNKSLNSHATGVGKATSAEGKKASQADKLVSSLLREIRAFTDSGKAALQAGRWITKAFRALVGISIGQWFADAVEESIAFQENMNLYSVAVGQAVTETDKFVDKITELYGLSYSSIYRAIGSFANLGTSLGMATGAAARMSTSLTKLSVDLASLFNMEPEKVFDDMASGLQGMTRAVRKYGMDIRATTLQQTALNYGLTQSVEHMSEVNRVALRYLTMLRQARNAMGDFAKQLEMPAVQLKVFREQVIELGRAIGNFFIAPLAAALPYINGFIMAIKEVLAVLAALVGFKAPKPADFAVEAEEAMDNFGAAAGGAAKQMKNMLAPFDELNILAEQAAGGGGGGGLDEMGLDPKLLEALENTTLALEEFRMKALDVRDSILSWLGFEWTDIFNPDTGEWERRLKFIPDQLKQNLIDAFPQWTKTITAVFEHWSGIVAGFGKVFKALGRVFDTVRQKINRFIATKIDPALASFISNLSGNLEGLANWIDRNNDLLANLIIVAGGLVVFSKLAGWVAPGVIGLVNLLGALAPIAAAVAPAVAAIALISGALYLVWTESEAFRAAVPEFFSTFAAGLDTIWTALEDSFTVLWPTMQAIWDSAGAPFFESLGNYLATVLTSTGTVWTAFAGLFSGVWTELTGILERQAVPLFTELVRLAESVLDDGGFAIETFGTVFADVMKSMETGFTTHVAPTIENIVVGIQKLINIIRELYDKVVSPIVTNIISTVERLWNSTLKPIGDKIIAIITGIIDIIMGLWNNTLSPIVSWLINTFGPTVANIFNNVWEVATRVFEGIGTVIDGLLTSLRGVIDFLAGVFTGDWKRALSGLANVFVGFANTIIGAMEGAINFVTGAINLFVSLIVDAVVNMVNIILDAIAALLEFIGISISVGVIIKPPAIPTVSLPRVPTVALAGGGVVTGPTTALVGEGRYDEAVLPLGGPVLEDLGAVLAGAAARNSPEGGGSQKVEVHVYIGGKEVDAEIFLSSERGRQLVGESTISGGIVYA